MALRGNAAFLWTVDGANYVHRLGSPLRNITPALFRRSFSHPTADGTSINTVSIGDGVWEYQATLRYDALPDSLLRMLRDGVDQTTLTYARDLTGGDEYDVMLIPGSGPTGMPTAQPDADMWWRGHYQVTVLLRATSAGPIAAHVYGTVDGNRVVFRHRGGEPMDDWSFSRAAVAGADTYRQRDGTLGEVTVDDVARTHWLDLDGDGVFEEPGLLLELGRENLLLRSEQFDNASWTKSGGGTGSAPVVTANDTTAPDGNGTADKIVFDAGGGTTSSDVSLIQQSVAVASVAHSGSLWLRGDSGGETIVFRHVAASSFTELTLTAEWQRFDVTETAAGTPRTFEFGVRQGLSGIGTINATATVYAWGAQLEVGEFPGSYIATTTAAVTRAVDIASHIMPAAIVDPSTPWTGYFRWEAGMDGGGGLSSPRIWQIGDGNFAPGDKLLCWRWLTATSVRVTHGNGSGFDSVDITGLTVERGDICELITAWGGDGTMTTYLFVNGTLAGSASLNNDIGGVASAWSLDGSGDVRVYYNSREGGANAGAMSLRDSVLVEGVVSGTAAQIRSAFTRYVDA